MGLTGAVLNEGGFKRHLISIENIGAGGLLFRSDIPHTLILGSPDDPVK